MRTVGNYRLRSLVGRGATSEVYTAEHALLGTVVALKLLRPELAEDPDQARALIDEGLRVRAIDHPNVVRVLDAGLDGPTCYLVMEHVAGETLLARLRRDRTLPEPEVRRLGAELADGVAAAHARGIVHRDLKPANVMLDGARPKIVDFGIAKHLGARSAITTGRMIGTLAYMAPEQLASGMIAPCTDIWALGVILFEALCGRHPFDHFDDGRCPQLFDEPARASAITTVSPQLDAILARCLARDPAMRVGSAAELARLLRGEIVVDEERITIDAGPVGSLPTLPPPAANAGATATSTSRPRSRTWLAVFAAVVLAGIGAGALLARDGDPPATSSPASPVTAPVAPALSAPTAPPVIVVPPPVVVTQPAAADAPPAARVERPRPKRTSPPAKATKPNKPPRRETLD